MIDLCQNTFGNTNRSRAPWLLLALLLIFPAETYGDNLTPPPKPGKNMVRELPVPAFTQPEAGASFSLPDIHKESAVAPASSAPGFLLKDVRFVGNSRLDRKELLTVAKPFLNREVSVIDLEELRVRISNYYISRGYINSGAILPDQKIIAGTVRYLVIEGKLTEIRVRGTGRLRPGYISKRMYPGDEVLQGERLQENFQLLLNDPLIERINGELKPGNEPGEALLDLDVTRSRPYSLMLSFDNYHPPSSGSYEFNIDGSLQNLTTLGDELFIHGEKSSGAWDITGLFTIPLNRWDTHLFIRWEDGDSSVVEESLKILDIESDYQSVEAGLNHPFYRTLQREFSAGISLSHRRSQTWMLGDTFPFSPGVESDGSAKTSVLRLTQEYSDRTALRVIALRSTFGIGLSALDATTHEDEPDSRFLAWIGQARYAHRLDSIQSRLLLRTDMQFATDALLPMERFTIGGRYSVRGYRENEMVRDNGFSASSELHYKLYGDPENRHELSVQLAPFIDMGSGWNKDIFDDAELLLSGGLGIIVNWNQLFAECFFAYAFNEPEKKVDDDLQDSGINFRLSWKPF